MPRAIVTPAPMARSLLIRRMDKEESLRRILVDAALDLFELKGCAGFCIHIPGSTPRLYVAAGDAQELCKLVARSEPAGRSIDRIEPANDEFA